MISLTACTNKMYNICSVFQETPQNKPHLVKKHPITMWLTTFYSFFFLLFLFLPTEIAKIHTTYDGFSLACYANLHLNAVHTPPYHTPPYHTISCTYSQSGVKELLKVIDGFLDLFLQQLAVTLHLNDFAFNKSAFRSEPLTAGTAPRMKELY